MKIYRRGKIWHLTASEGDRRVRKSLRTTDRKIAAAAALELLRSCGDHSEDWTLAQAVETCTQVRQWSLARRGQAWAAVGYFGRAKLLSDITTESMDNYVTHLRARGNGDGTVNCKLFALSACLRVAHERGAIRVLPTIPLRPEPAGKTRWLTEAEEVALLGHLEPRVAALVVLLVDSGMRLGEGLAARPEDVHGSMLSIPAGKGPARRIPLTARALDALKLRPWSALSRSSLQHRLRAACTQAGLIKVSWHTLRHTCATRLAHRGVHLSVAQEFLGHSSLDATMRYTHVAGDGLQEALAALETRPAPTLRIAR